MPTIAEIPIINANLLLNPQCTWTVGHQCSYHSNEDEVLSQYSFHCNLVVEPQQSPLCSMLANTTMQYVATTVTSISVQPKYTKPQYSLYPVYTGIQCSYYYINNSAIQKNIRYNQHTLVIVYTPGCIIVILPKLL